ncbi:MAG: hypothetical protein ACSHWS_05890 [Sulfitobacter sp.]
MNRAIVAVLLTTLAACTDPAATGGRGPYTSPRYAPEPTTPGVHISGHVIVGVSTVK